ncbi:MULTISPECIES: acetate--CoA ligase family protein [Microbacterium]|nr:MULTISPECIES: acetate--CoA ligase family protein [Microbacterium]MCK6066136.1 acetate--CoA ligase family protein [Microbacterium sp. EYE_512]
MKTLHDALFHPASIAIVGASDNPAKTTARPLAFLREAGWAGSVYPVNPTRSTVRGEKAYPSVTALPEVPDHVYVLAASDLVAGIVRECAETGVPVVTVMADGFVESDPQGGERIAALRAAIAGTRTRILGPSSLGVAEVRSGLALTANAAFAERDLPVGGVFVASQSGSVIGALLSRSREMGIGLAALVSTGGELDLSLGEICEGSLDDPQVTSYALFLENLNASEDLRRFARGAAERGKPIVAYKLGRTAAGAELSVSHTGAMAGDDAVASAFFADLGIARVANFEALLEAQLLVASAPLEDRPHRAPRVAVVSTTGGGGAMMVDCLGAAGAAPTAPSEETVARLEAQGVRVGHGTLIDLTLAGTRYEVMKAALDVLCTAPEFDVVLAVPGSSARFSPEHAVKPIAESAGYAKPVAAFVMPDAPDALKLLRKSGIAAFRTPEAAADAIVSAFSRRRPRDLHVTASRWEGATRVMDEAESAALLAGAGLTFAPFAELAVGSLPEHLPVEGPVAVKVLSADLPHKSDVGGVRLGVQDGAGLHAAAAAIVASVAEKAPGVPVERVLVQQMVTGVGEVLIGYRDDPAVGPIVLLAAGGVLAELYQDRTLRLAPVQLDVAREMVQEITALRALSGYRSLPEGDLEGLAEAVVAVSRLGIVSDGAVQEAEANPVMVMTKGNGVVAVDALVRVAQERQRS